MTVQDPELIRLLSVFRPLPSVHIRVYRAGLVLTSVGTERRLSRTVQPTTFPLPPAPPAVSPRVIRGGQKSNFPNGIVLKTPSSYFITITTPVGGEAESIIIYVIFAHSRAYSS